jgi:photosystem II stability/assembly factor-like uncharacterized protein
MRMRGAIAILLLAAALTAVLVAGSGGGSASTGAAARAVGVEEERGGFEEEFVEEEAGGIVIEGEAGHRHILEGEMVAGDEGWVRTPDGVFWTPYGGRTWRRMTPPVPDLGQIDGVYFADRRRGWALWDTGRENDSRPSMYRTSDGGRTWHRIRLRDYDEYAPVTEVSFSSVGRHEIFALTRVNGDPARFFGPLFVSRDSGRHWRALPPPPEAGELSFETPRRGWIAAGRDGQSLLRTVDGGRTWREVVPGKPFGTPPPTEAESIHNTRWTSYTPPLLGPDGHGIVGMVEAHENGLETGPAKTVIWQTSDFGRSWHRDRVELPEDAGLEASKVFIRRGPDSLLVRDPGSGISTVVGLDGKAGPPQPSQGLPRESTELTFSDESHGFAFPSFSGSSSLSFTEDGGSDWTRVSLPPACQRKRSSSSCSP